MQSSINKDRGSCDGKTFSHRKQPDNNIITQQYSFIHRHGTTDHTLIADISFQLRYHSSASVEEREERGEDFDISIERQNMKDRIGREQSTGPQ